MEMSFWYCDTCLQNIRHGAYVFNCTICDNYDQCEQCYTMIERRHDHPMVREVAFGYGKTVENNSNDMASLILEAFDVYTDRYCFGIRDMDSSLDGIYANSYSWLTYQTIGTRTKNFSHGLRNLLEAREYVGICAANRPEWLIADFACVLDSIISVPMYCLFSDREFLYVMNNTDISVVICDRIMLPTFIRLYPQCPKLRHIICMDPISDSTVRISEENGSTLHYMEDIELNGSIKQFEYVRTKPDDCMTIMYTSGTSGFPKGVMISENSFRSQFKEVCGPYNGERVLLSYRPLSWGADRNSVYSIFLEGGRTGFSTGDISRLMEEIALVRPTSFSSSPSIWNKIYSEFKCELSLAINYQQMNPEEAEQELLKKFSKLMPNRCRTIAIGGAMVSQQLLTFIKRCFPRCQIIESYGSTECGGIAFDNTFCSNIEYRLESVSEMGYTTDDKPFPRGELLVKSKEMFLGYMNNFEETKEALTDDGFFRTGDIVQLQIEDNKKPKIYVIDRKKNFFKLANGQFISPEFLEGIYMQSPFIAQIYVHGDPMDNRVLAIIIPNQEYAQAFATKNNLISFDMKNPDQKFYDAIINDLYSIAIKESLRKHEIPYRFIIDFEPFTAENGLLTPSLKLCRRKIALNYADQLKNPHTIEEQLKQIVETAIGQQLSMDKTMDFMSVGGHSLAAVRMSHTIQNELGIDIPFDLLFQSHMTLEKLTNLIKDPSQIASLSDMIISKMYNDANMELNLPFGLPRTINDSPSTIFITGVTGFVGAFLLNELLMRYPLSCKFICLVRCNESSMDPFDRIYQNMLSLCLWKEEYKQRIIPLQGDLAKEKFGLNNQDYENLAKQIDLIFHCGAIVNFVLPYSQLYGSNVFGTYEIIRLASYTSTSIPVHYISTTSVLSKDNNTIESIDAISFKHLPNGYSQSKWVAEKLIEKASQAGLPVVTYRLGLILPDTETGACNRNDFYTLLILAITKIRCYPTEANTSIITGVPANIAVRNIVDLSQNKTNLYGNTYDIVNKENILLFENIFECIRNCGLQIESVPYNQWRNKLFNQKIRDSSLTSLGELLPDNSFKVFNKFISDSFNNHQSQFNSSLLNNDYIMKWLHFLLNNFIIDE